MFLCGNFALKPLQIGEIMSNNEIIQFSYFYWKSNADEKTTLFHDRICHVCEILRDASGKMHHGTLFDRRGAVQELALFSTEALSPLEKPSASLFRDCCSFVSVSSMHLIPSAMSTLC